jgi:hypothetical protein
VRRPDLKITSDADQALDQLRLDFHQAASAFTNGLPSNRFAVIEGSRLVLNARYARPRPVGRRRTASWTPLRTLGLAATPPRATTVQPRIARRRTPK